MAIDKIQAESINLADTFAFTGTVTGAGGVNTPYFSAKATGNQTGLSSGGWTKVQFDTATFNEGSDYDTTNDKFVAPSAGKYFFTASVKVNSAGGSTTLQLLNM